MQISYKSVKICEKMLSTFLGAINFNSFIMLEIHGRFRIQVPDSFSVSKCIHSSLIFEMFLIIASCDK